MGRKAFSGKGGIDEIGKKIGNLGLLRAMGAYNWALKPCGSVFPYFCIVTIHDKGYVRARISFLEGWQTMHDYVRMRFEPDSGYYVSQTELPQFEVAYLRTGKIVATRHDPGCLPWYLTPRQEGLVRRMLWETYGVMLRIENDRSLVLKHADERALFARVETSPGVWRDAPMTIPEPPPYEERVPVPQDLLKRAQSLPVDKDWKVAVDLRYLPDRLTEDAPPRVCYAIRAVDLAEKTRLIDDGAFVDMLNGGLKTIWLDAPVRILERLVERGRLPGEIRVVSARLFRFLRPLFLELPVKLSKRKSIPFLEEHFRA